MIYICEKRKRKGGLFFFRRRIFGLRKGIRRIILGGSTHWRRLVLEKKKEDNKNRDFLRKLSARIERGYWRILKIFGGGEEQRKRKRAIATKAIQVCFSLLLEFLPMFDFPARSFLNIYCIVDLVWTERAMVCFVEIGCLLVYLVLILGVIDVFESI